MLVWSFLFITTALFSALYTVIGSQLNHLSYGFIPLWIILGILTAAILFVIWIFILIYLILPLTKPGSKVLLRLVRPIVIWINRLCKMHITVIGKENIPNETFVVFSNHKSMLDVTVIYEALNRPLSAMAKSELANVPVLKTLSKGLKVEYVDRSNDREAVKNLLKAIKKVERGLNFLIFPEGGIKTRETELMTDLKPGAYKLATKPRAVILPISLIGTSKLSENSFKKRTNIKVIIHKPIYPIEYETFNTHEIGEHVGKIINEGIENGR